MTKRKIIILSVLGVVVLLLVAGAVLAWYMLTQQITGIYINNLPSKCIYYVGEELQLDGLEVNAKKRTSSYNHSIDLEDLTISGFDSSVKCDAQQITVTYGKFTTKFVVVIQELPTVEKFVTGIELHGKDGAEIKTVYELYEDFEVDKLELLVSYSDGSTEYIPVTDEDVKIEGYDYRRPATDLEVTFTYKGRFTTLLVDVVGELPF